ncbi:glycosyltransferase family 2 protein [Spongorhabdus nitratireducens]
MQDNIRNINSKTSTLVSKIPADVCQTNTPLVSVIVTCYNHDQYIEDAIQSVLGQTYENIELIVVNDGSTDKSEEILNRLSAQHNFKVIHQYNKGLSEATNTGLKEANGKFIALLDSDDIFLPDKISKQVRFMCRNQDIAICGGNMLIINDKKELASPRRFSKFRTLDFDDVFMDKKDIIPASSAMIRKDVTDKIGGFDPSLKLIQDRYFWLKATAAGYKIAGMNDLLIYYRKHDKNIHRNHRAMTENLLHIIEMYPESNHYETVKFKTLKSMFLKTSMRDKSFAIQLIKKIPIKAYDKSVLKGFLRLIFR